MSKNDVAYGGRIGRYLSVGLDDARHCEPWEDLSSHQPEEGEGSEIFTSSFYQRKVATRASIVKGAAQAREVIEYLADSLVDAAIRSALEVASRIRQRPISAIIDDRVETYNSSKEKFEELAKIWRRFNRAKSVINYAHYAYFQVVGMGWTAVPFLLNEVEKGDGTWYVALQYIVGERAESPEMRGDLAAVQQAWLTWGQKHGYKIEPSQALGSH